MVISLVGAWNNSKIPVVGMGAYYDEIEIEDMTWDDVKKKYHYPCPCGDRFEISKAQLANYEDIATCPSCSLIIRVIYDPVSGHISPLPSPSLIVSHSISSITKTIPRTTKAASSDDETLIETSVSATVLQSATASGGEKKLSIERRAPTTARLPVPVGSENPQ